MILSAGWTLLMVAPFIRADSIHDAAFRGDATWVKELLDKDASVVNQRDKAGSRKYSVEGSTPLHYAALYSGGKRAVELLLSRKADTRAVNVDGRTPLHEVCATTDGTPEDTKDRQAIAQMLLANKADINGRDKKGLTPIHLAAYHGNKGLVKVLLEHKADVNAIDAEGQTPLHWAIQKRDLPEDVQNPLAVVKLLLAHGAKVNAKDRSGLTPYGKAKKSGLKDLVDILLDHGAKE